MVVDAIVKLHARLHGVDHVLLGTVATNRGVDILGGLVHGTEGRERVQHNGNIRRFQLFGGVQRCGAELGDVRQDRRLHAGGEQLVHLQFSDGFREHHVGTGLDARGCTLQGGLQALDCQGVGTRHDHEAVIGARIHGGLDAVDHFLLGHDFFVGAMTAALGAHLVFDMDGGGAELDHRLDGTRHVERRGAETGVHVHQQRQVAHVGNAAHVGEHVIQAGDTQVRHAEGAGGYTAT